MIEVEQILGPTEAVRRLVGDLESELAEAYPPEQRHGLSIEAIFEPHMRFFVASVEGDPAGCGGVALFDGFAEVKRMFVSRRFRGTGVAAAIMERLTEVARSEGRGLLVLETGEAQHAAIRFYRRCGFEKCDAFEPYASKPAHSIATSVFFAKRLGA